MVITMAKLRMVHASRLGQYCALHRNLALLSICLATAHNSVIRQQVTARVLGPTGLVLRFLPGHVLCELLCRSYWVEGVIFWLRDFLCDSFRYVLNTINTRCIKYLVFDTFSFQIQ